MRSRLQEVLAEKGISTAQLAEATGLSVRSIHNLSCKGGGKKSRSGCQRITNFLQVCIWPDCPLERQILLRPGDEIDLLFEQEAMTWEAALGDAVDRVGCLITLRKSVDLVLHGVARSSPEAPEGSSTFDRRLNFLRRELSIRSEDFRAGRISLAEARAAHRAAGKKLALLRHEASADQFGALKLLAVMRRSLAKQIFQVEAHAASDSESNFPAHPETIAAPNE